MKKKMIFIYIVLILVVGYNIYLIRTNIRLKDDYNLVKNATEKVTLKEEVSVPRFDFIALNDLVSVDNLKYIGYFDGEARLHFIVSDMALVDPIYKEVIELLHPHIYTMILHEYPNESNLYDMTINVKGGTNEQ